MSLSAAGSWTGNIKTWLEFRTMAKVITIGKVVTVKRQHKNQANKMKIQVCVAVPCAHTSKATGSWWAVTRRIRRK